MALFGYSRTLTQQRRYRWTRCLVPCSSWSYLADKPFRSIYRHRLRWGIRDTPFPGHMNSERLHKTHCEYVMTIASRTYHAKRNYGRATKLQSQDPTPLAADTACRPIHAARYLMPAQMLLGVKYLTANDHAPSTSQTAPYTEPATRPSSTRRLRISGTPKDEGSGLREGCPSNGCRSERPRWLQNQLQYDPER